MTKFLNFRAGNFRKRGFTLIEIVLVLAVGLGLIVGGIIFYKQASAASEVNDKTRAIVSAVSEVRAQTRTQADTYVIADATVKAAASMDPTLLSSLTFGGNPLAATVAVTTSDPKICARLALGDFGANITTKACGGTPATTLTVTFGR
ncbi:prepilin-type N-terminal cleavage/methylation domain-containing protein [Paracoccus litorisediminis]|uniref:type II secretion system protein n=1 Tax=Paracoccus litorisediminis TaxID=2006130 RepID=UPI003730C41D